MFNAQDNYCHNVLNIADASRCPISVWNRLNEDDSQHKQLARALYGGSVYHPLYPSSFNPEEDVVESAYPILDEIEDIIFEVRNSWEEGTKLFKKPLDHNVPILIGHDMWTKFHDIFFECSGAEVYSFIRLYDMTVKRSTKIHNLMGNLVLKIVQDLFSSSVIHGVVWQHQHNRNYFSEVDTDIIGQGKDTFIREILSGDKPSFTSSKCSYCYAGESKHYCSAYKVFKGFTITDKNNEVVSTVCL